MVINKNKINPLSITPRGFFCRLLFQFFLEIHPRIILSIQKRLFSFVEFKHKAESRTLTTFRLVACSAKCATYAVKLAARAMPARIGVFATMQRPLIPGTSFKLFSLSRMKILYYVFLILSIYICLFV